VFKREKAKYSYLQIFVKKIAKGEKARNTLIINGKIERLSHPPKKREIIPIKRKATHRLYTCT
jgi:hypothetical protein